MIQKQIKLDNRLHCVLNLVRNNSVVADIGTDHAYLATALIQQNKSPFVYACDLNELPLACARNTVEEYNLEQFISLVLSDGLENLPLNKIDDIVIAGMGGELICTILHRALANLSPNHHFILQAMTKDERLRQFLCENGFDIQRERAVRVRNHIYSVICAVYDGVKKEYDDQFLTFGKIPLNDDDFSKQYVVHKQSKLAKIQKGISKSNKLSAQLGVE